MEARVKISYAKLLGIVIVSIIFFNIVNDSEKFKSIIAIFAPLFTAFAMAYLLNPMVEFISKKFKVARGVGILITCIIVVGIIGFSIVIAIPYLISSAKDLIELFPSYFQSTYELVEKIEIATKNTEILDLIQRLKSSMNNLEHYLGTWVSEMAPTVFEKAVSYTMSIFSLVISFFMAVYMLIDRNDLIARIKRMIYAYRDQEKADYIIFVIKKADMIFGKFLVGKFIDSMIIGILCFVILSIFGMKNIVLISFIIGVTNMIPYFGPFIGAVPAIFITFIVNPIDALWIAAIIFALQQFDGIYLGPKILGDKIGVGPFWILVAVTLGGKMFGVLGMLLGVPFIVWLKELIELRVDSRLTEKNMEDYAKDDLNVKKTLTEKIKLKINVKK